MEDRHAISEPRLLDAGIPSWSVDITREGVIEPVDTIEINEQTLPPRLKKGKVIWRLPTDPSKMPSFPVDERRRIMELFKERKKQRKKKASAKVVTSKEDTLKGVYSDENGSNIVTHSESKLHMNHEVQIVESDGIIDNSRTNSKDQTVGNQTKEESFEHGILSISQQPQKETVSARFQRKRIERKSKSQSSEAINLSVSSSESNQEISVKNKERKALHILEEAVYRLSMLEDEDNFDGAVGLRNQIQNIVSAYPHIHNDLQNHSSDLSTTQSAKIPQHTLLPHERCFVIPDHDRSIDPNSSLTVAAAKVFVDSYYLFIAHGMTSELVNYYTNRAQKSVSVGGAHSVVGTRADIALQLSSLSGSNFVVRGVVSQDLYDQRGAHVLVTGVVQTTAGILTPFAHSISLIPVRGRFEFQIHNDALSLMTPSDEWDRTSLQPPQGVPLRPPGLGF